MGFRRWAVTMALPGPAPGLAIDQAASAVMAALHHQ